MDALERYSSLSQSHSPRDYPLMRREHMLRVARSCHLLESLLTWSPVSNWIAELEAGASARTHFWLDMEEPKTTRQEPSLRLSVQPQLLRILVLRSQVLRVFEPFSPKEILEHHKHAQQLMRRWQARTNLVPDLLHPDTARGTLRLLRPPGIGLGSI